MRYLLTYKRFGEKHSLGCDTRAEAIEKLRDMSRLVEYSDLALYCEVLNRDVLEMLDALHDCQPPDVPDAEVSGFKWVCDDCGQSWITYDRDGQRESVRVGDPLRTWPKTRQG